jgi:hypothetical protein
MVTGRRRTLVNSVWRRIDEQHKRYATMADDSVVALQRPSVPSEQLSDLSREGAQLLIQQAVEAAVAELLG